MNDNYISHSYVSKFYLNKESNLAQKSDKFPAEITENFQRVITDFVNCMFEHKELFLSYELSSSTEYYQQYKPYISKIYCSLWLSKSVKEKLLSGGAIPVAGFNELTVVGMTPKEVAECIEKVDELMQDCIGERSWLIPEKIVKGGYDFFSLSEEQKDKLFEAIKVAVDDLNKETNVMGDSEYDY